jgi:hypothetical protein
MGVTNARTSRDETDKLTQITHPCRCLEVSDPSLVLYLMLDRLDDHPTRMTTSTPAIQYLRERRLISDPTRPDLQYTHRAKMGSVSLCGHFDPSKYGIRVLARFELCDSDRENIS